MNEHSVNSPGKRHQSQSSQNAYSRRTNVNGVPCDNTSNGFDGMTLETGPEPMAIDQPTGDVTQDMAEVIIDVDISKTTDKSSDHKKKQNEIDSKGMDKAFRATFGLRNSCGGVIKLKHTQRTPQELDAWKETLCQKLNNKLKNAGEENPDTDIPFKQFDETQLMYVSKTASFPLTVESNLLIRLEKNIQKVDSYVHIKHTLTQSSRISSSAKCRCHKCHQSAVPRWSCLQRDSFISERLTESKYVEFKHFPEKKFKNFSEVKEKIQDNVTAFSNTEGGTLYIGVHDNGKVLGQSIENRQNIETLIQQCISEIVLLPFSKEENESPLTNCEVRYIPVDGGEPNLEVIAIDICKVVNGVVFRGEPKCPTVDWDGNVVDMPFEDWLEYFNEPEHDPKYEVAKLGPIVYKKLKGTIDGILQGRGTKENGIPCDNASNEFNGISSETDNTRKVEIHPKHAKEWINSDALNRLLDIVQRSMTSGGHVFVQKCWNALLGKPNLTPPSSSICDVLLCSPEFPLVLVTLVDSHDTHYQEARSYNTALARTLKTVLTQEAGCVKECVVKPIVITCHHAGDLDSQYITHSIFSLPDSYPEGYNSLIRDNYVNVRKSLALVLTRIKPLANVSTDVHLEHFLVLTKVQYTILNRFYKSASKVVIRGLPGTGKTVLALERIRQLRESGVEYDKVLYVCSNRCLEATVKSQLGRNGEPLCKVHNNTTLANNPGMVGEFKHVIADEVHNYEDRSDEVKGEGWWEKVMEYRSCTFWMFLDESQRIATGVASPVDIDSHGNVSYNLSTVVRTTHKIFNFYKHFIEEDTSDVEFGHDMDGTEPRILVAATETSNTNILLSILNELIVNEGHSPSDVTVLFNNENEMKNYTRALSRQATNFLIRNGEKPRKPGVIFESIRRYSGEQNSTVIGFCPTFDHKRHHQENKALMVSLCSRAMLNLILVFADMRSAVSFLQTGFDAKETYEIINNQFYG